MKSEFKKLQNIVLEAGTILKYYYENNDKVRTTTKQDNSPVTNADIEVNNFLINKFQNFGLPTVSEETLDVEHQKDFFLVDPLDGTSQFIRGKKEFCISVAVVKDFIPYIGLIYAPITEEFYGFDGEKIISNQYSKDFPYLTAVISREGDMDFNYIYEKIGVVEIFNIKSAIKYGRMAMGIGDINIRNCPISSWDIAAGYAILKGSNFEFLDIHGEEINFVNPYNEINGVVIIGPKAKQYKDIIV